MLRHLSTVRKFKIHANDGDIGTVTDLLFDNETWTIRYLVVAPEGWISGHEVLISPISVRGVDWNGHRVDVNLTCEQVKNSPDITSDPPVSRQHEAPYYAYYGYPFYWGGAGLWGPGLYPDALLSPIEPLSAPADTESKDTEAEERADPHLRSIAEVTGYNIQASDGHIGHVEDFLIEPRSWRIEYVTVDTRNWWPGKQVLIAPSWITSISWEDRDVVVPHSRDIIKEAPEFTDVASIDETFIQHLKEYYKQP